MIHPIRPDLVKRVRVLAYERWFLRESDRYSRMSSLSALNASNRPLRFR